MSDEMFTNEERIKIIQWCLDNGAGIDYDYHLGLTTDKERKSCRPRYVNFYTVDYYLRHPNKDQIRFAVEERLSFLDFDEWQAIQELLFKTSVTGYRMEYQCARDINEALWRYEDTSPLNLI